MITKEELDGSRVGSDHAVPRVLLPTDATAFLHLLSFTIASLISHHSPPVGCHPTLLLFSLSLSLCSQSWSRLRLLLLLMSYLAAAFASNDSELLQFSSLPRSHTHTPFSCFRLAERVEQSTGAFTYTASLAERTFRTNSRRAT